MTLKGKLPQIKSAKADFLGQQGYFILLAPIFPEGAKGKLVDLQERMRNAGIELLIEPKAIEAVLVRLAGLI